MRLHPSFAVATTVLLLSAPMALAARLDTPDVTLSQISRSSVRLDIRAGSSGAPAGFSVMWMKRSDYEALGWQPVGSAGVWSSNFFGFPTYNVTEGVVSYELGAGETQIAEAGDLFDETGIIATQALELDPSTDYVFRAWANASGATSPSSYYSTEVFATTLSITNCTYTQGYWKNHPSVWPVTSLTLGTVNS
jgi:hypothetical protein